VTVATVILNYCTADLAVACLRSLEAEMRSLGGARAIVVDNGSPDGSAALIRKAVGDNGWSAWATLMPLARNAGFSAGNNAAIRRCLSESSPPEYIHVLNPDTVVRPGALLELAAFLDAHPDAGIVGSALEDEAGRPQCSAHRFPSPLGELEAAARLGALSRLLKRYVSAMEPADRPHPCDWVSGSSMMIRRQVFESIGLFDEGYFLYFDEVDFCRRAKAAGWQVWYVPQSRVVHLHGRATGIVRGGRRRPEYWYASRRRFFLKHYGLLGLVAADLLWGAGRLSLAIRRSLGLGGGSGEDEPLRLAADLLLGDAWAILCGGNGA